MSITRPRPCPTGAAAAGSCLFSTNLLLLLGLLLHIIAGTTHSFAPSVPLFCRQERQQHHGGISRLLALKRLEGETEKAYFQRVTAAASDPEAFERMVSGDTKKTPLAAAAAAKTNGTDDCDHDNNNKPRKGYVPVEEWEAEQKRKGMAGELSWEERVQFDGQRSGDRFKQNEILRHNLHTW